MANQPTKQQKTGKTKERKLLLGSLFVDAPVRTEPEEPQKIVVAGLVEAKIKKEYPDSFFGRAWAVLKGEFSSLFKGSLFFILFTLPFILVLTLASGYFKSYILGDSFNFMGGIGIGYPGLSDSMIFADAKLIWEVKQPILMMLAGAGIIASIGMAGLFYSCKRKYFQNDFKRISKTYFMGIGKYWWKFLLVSAFGILVTLAIGTSMLYLLAQQTLGTASAGAYCGVVFSFLIGLPLLCYCMVLLSLFTVYDMSFKDTMKDALVLIVNNPITVILTGAISAAPLLIPIMGNTIAIIVYLVMSLVGFVLVALLWVAMANKGMTKCHILYAAEAKNAAVVYKSANGKQSNAKKSNNKNAEKKSYFNTSSANVKSEKGVQDKAAVANHNNSDAKKKQPQKVVYQNPKKKKKK